VLGVVSREGVKTVNKKALPEHWREPQAVHQQLADVMDACVAQIKQIWAEARAKGAEVKRPAWPMIVFRTPKGWTCPPEIDGKKCEDYWRSHQVPMGAWTSSSTSRSSNSG
jgi:phosphoketolase